MFISNNERRRINDRLRHLDAVTDARERFAHKDRDEVFGLNLELGHMKREITCMREQVALLTRARQAERRQPLAIRAEDV